MISTKVKLLAVLLLVVVSVHQSEEKNFFKKITKPFKKAIHGVGKITSKIGKETHRAISKVGKTGKRLFKNVITGPLAGLSKLTYPILTHLKIIKKGKAVIGTDQPLQDVNAPPNEQFDVKLLRLHNEIRKEVKSEPALKWDTLLAKAAQEWADKCSTGYKLFGDSRDETYGQNMYAVKEEKVDAFNAVQMWKSFSDGYIKDTFECQENQDCYPYMQMIWPNTKYVGCGFSQCDNIEDLKAAGSVLVCFYTPL